MDGIDFLAWQRGFGTPAPLATKRDGDADDDQDVDGDDLTAWKNQFGSPLPPATSSALSANEAAQISLSADRLEHPIDLLLLANITEYSSVSPRVSSSKALDEAFLQYLPEEIVFLNPGRRVDRIPGFDRPGPRNSDESRFPMRTLSSDPGPWESILDELLSDLSGKREKNQFN